MKKKIVAICLLALLLVGAGWNRGYYRTVSRNSFRSYAPFLEKINFNNIDYPRLNAAIYYVTNETRRKHGLKWLSYAKQLEIAAWHHSRDMAKRGYFSHTNPYSNRRSRASDRGRLAGIRNPYLAENIANSFAFKYRAGTSVYRRPGKGKYSYTLRGAVIPNHTYLSFADAVVRQWMNSPGHRRNILSTKALQLGCGAYFFWKRNFPRFMSTQNFQWFRRIQSGSAVDSLPPSFGGGGHNNNDNQRNNDDNNRDSDREPD